MMDAATLAALHAILARERRSLFQYASDVFPWITSEEGSELAAVQKMIAEERDGGDAIAKLLIRRHLTLPYVGSYPASFTSINFVSLAHLSRLLIEDERRSMAELQPKLAALNDPEARQVVQNLFDMKQRHLQELEAMAAQAPAAMAR
jgi:rubrerythrin